MKYPIVNVIIAAGFKFEDVENIQETDENVNSIKKSFKEKWEQKSITDEQICNDLFDYNKVPDWIKTTLENERSEIQHLIKIAD